MRAVLHLVAMIDARVAALLLAGAGAIIGSFLATVVARGPGAPGLVAGRSRCDACGHRLSAAELVPLGSALWQGGRCRHCGVAIDAIHWRIEAACAVLGLAAGLLLPPVQAVCVALGGWLLLALAAADARHLWLPDMLSAPLALTGLVLGGAAFGTPLEARFIGLVVGWAALWVIAEGYRALRGRAGMGGGDPKLAGAIGAWLGWQALPPVLLVASLAGLGWALAQRKERGDALPFGLLLAIGAATVAIVQLALGR